jgi:hypothetical protein
MTRVIHVHLYDAPQKFVTKVDIRLPEDPVWGNRSGKVIPNGTVMYKEAGGYRPWFMTGAGRLRLDPSQLVSEGADKAKDAVAPAKVKAHPQFTQGDYDYLKGKGWSDDQILKRWDEEKSKGVKPNQGNKNAKPGDPGYMSATDSVASVEKEIATQQRLIDAAKANGKDVPAQVTQRMAFLKEELAKEKAKTSDANPDGTIGPNEEQELKALMTEANSVMKKFKERAYQIGGSFRGPGYWKRVQTFIG